MGENFSMFYHPWRPLHDSVAKEKSAEILLIEAGNEANLATAYAEVIL